MKIIIWFTALVQLLLCSCNASRPINENQKEVLKDSIPEEELMVTFGAQTPKWAEEFLAPYIDSVNRFSLDCKDLPSFVYDKNFDLRDTLFLINYALSSIEPTFYSYRVELFRRTNNRHFLECIVNAPHNLFSLDKVPRKRIPSDTFDNISLSKIRLWEMQNGKDSFYKIGMTSENWPNYEEFNFNNDSDSLYYIILKSIHFEPIDSE